MPSIGHTVAVSSTAISSPATLPSSNRREPGAEPEVHSRPPALGSRQSLLPANELREKVFFARVRSSSVEGAPREADLSRDVKGLGARRCGSKGTDLPMPQSVRELDGLDTLEAMEVKTIPLKSSFQLATELVVAHDRSSREIVTAR